MNLAAVTRITAWLRCRFSSAEPRHSFHCSHVPIQVAWNTEDDGRSFLVNYKT